MTYAPKKEDVSDAAAQLGDHDFIVCGAGPAGSVLAGRLAENPEVRVLLIEAGGSDEVPEVMLPHHWPQNLNSERDWAFVAEPNPHLNNRAIPLNMGKVCGGGSSINVMVWARGTQQDWDHYAEEAGDADWGYESVLRIYRRIENWQGKPDARRRGSGGPLFIETARDPQPVALAFVEAAAAVGLPTFDSPNGAMMEGRGGAALNDLTIRDGRRASVFQSYVAPLRSRPNLTVLTHSLVSRVIFEGKKAVGVEVVWGPERRIYRAEREVILSMGAIQTAKVLMQSGVGPAAELRLHGIPVIVDLPGVGRNHQDHVSIGCIFESREPQQVGHGGSEATLYWKTDPALALPDLFHCQLEFPVATGETASLGVPKQGWMVFAGLAHPKSRGSVHLTGPDVNAPVRIFANTLSHPDDLRTALASIDLCRQMAASAPFAPLLRREAMPGKLAGQELEAYVRNAAVTFWHQACTAKMGRDPMSVVDARLKVYGIEQLRIADASILPDVPSGNTMAPCVVIGERAAEILEAEHGI